MNYTFQMSKIREHYKYGFSVDFIVTGLGDSDYAVYQHIKSVISNTPVKDTSDQEEYFFTEVFEKSKKNPQLPLRKADTFYIPRGWREKKGKFVVEATAFVMKGPVPSKFKLIKDGGSGNLRQAQGEHIKIPKGTPKITRKLTLEWGKGTKVSIVSGDVDEKSVKGAFESHGKAEKTSKKKAKKRKQQPKKEEQEYGLAKVVRRRKEPIQGGVAFTTNKKKY